MKKYNPKQFDIPKLKGISQKTIDEHLKLYEGYVKNSNLILEKMSTMSDNEDHSYALSELQRRFSFEFDGMRNHEYYFSSLEGEANEINESGDLYNSIAEEWGSFSVWLSKFKNLAKTRGIGWAILYFDKKDGKLINCWVDEQHIGHLTGLSPILALDVWEHSFVADYQPSGKGQYIEDFFENLNWKIIEENFRKAQQ